MTKKLFVIGAGASKDINPDMPLGKDIIESINDLPITIYYELIALVASRFAVDLTGISFFIWNDFQFTCLIEQITKEQKSISKESIEKFITALIENYHHAPATINQKFSNSDRQEIIARSLKFLIDDNPTYPGNKSKLPCLIPLFNPRDALASYNYVINFIFIASSNKNKKQRELEEKIKNELKRYLLLSDNLWEIVTKFNNKNCSIDHLMNFLGNTCYHEREEDIKEFAKQYITRLIARESFAFEDDWISYLEVEIFQNKNPAQKIKEISLINFNYDTIIEDHFEREERVAAYKLEMEKHFKKFTKVAKSSHIYGKIAKDYDYDKTIPQAIINQMKWLCDPSTSTEKLEYINSLIEGIKRSGKNIDFIRTSQDQEKIKKEFNKIKEAEKFYFLGFGFDKWNLRNIGIFDDSLEQLTNEAQLLSNKIVNVTNVGDLPRIRLILERIFGVRIERESEKTELDDKGKEIKHFFWRSRNDHTNKRNNEVRISTKGVYRALTEDFD